MSKKTTSRARARSNNAGSRPNATKASKRKLGSQANTVSNGKKSTSKQGSKKRVQSRSRMRENQSVDGGYSSDGTQARKSSSKPSTKNLKPLAKNSKPLAKPSESSATKNGQPVQNAPTKVTFVEIDENHDGQRLDNFLITHLKGVPKTHIYRIIRKGEIRVNKGRVKQTSRLSEGDLVRIPPIRLGEKSISEFDGNKFSFLADMVLFEDDALLVLNKPSGMAVHAGSGIKVGVIEALRAFRTDLKYIELVHRLDRETSGVLVMAKKASALKILHDDFKTNSLKNPRLDKRYLTLVRGQWKHGQRRVTKALNTNARRHGERNVVVDPNGSYASSIMTPKSTSELASLIEVKLLTGRTHQVRVHCLSENHPVAGDPKYGDDDFNKKLKSSGLHRLFLHAAKLTFFHPITQQSVSLEAPLPKELQAVVNNLALASN